MSSTLRSFRVAPNSANTLVIEGWVETEIVDTHGQPVSGVQCEISLPGEHEPRVGVTGNHGRFALTYPIEQTGEAEITFTSLVHARFSDPPAEASGEEGDA